MDITLGSHPLLRSVEIRRGIIKPLENAFMADVLFTKTSSNALSVKYYQDADRDEMNRAIYDMAPEIGEASRFPRIGFSETEKQEFIRKYGVEAKITYEMQRFANEASPIARAFRKVRGAVLNTVDKMAYRVVTNQWGAGSDEVNKITPDIKWDNDDAGFTIFTKSMMEGIATLEENGYYPDTVVINPSVFNAILSTTSFVSRMNNAPFFVSPSETAPELSRLKKRVVEYVGTNIQFIIDPNLVTPDGKKDTVIMCERGTIGEIADAIPLTAQTYNIEEEMTTVIRAFRFTTAYLTDPKAIVVFDDVCETM
jgi:hypothetical protein